MFDKKKWIHSISTMLMAFAIITPFNGSLWLLGEPELPKYMKK